VEFCPAQQRRSGPERCGYSNSKETSIGFILHLYLSGFSRLRLT
jgi:hypothetical protein